MPDDSIASDAAMVSRALSGLVASVGWIVACSGPVPTSDGDADADRGDAREVDTTGVDAFGNDTSTSLDVPTTVDAGGDGSACVTSDAGAVQQNYYCDLAVIHVLQHTGGTARVIVQARVGAGTDTCGAIDGVDILRGSTMLGQLGVSASVVLGAQYADIASGDAPASLVSECTNEATRLSAYGLVIRGRDSHGPFEARCGTADSGSRWPPGTSLACHQNIERPAFGPGMITLSSGHTASSVNFTVELPHALGSVSASTVDSTIRVVSPQRFSLDPGSPLTSHDTTGWMGLVSESMSSFLGPSTSISLGSFGTTPVLDSQLCPTPTMPGPGFVPPPWFLARITGQGPAGAYSAEVLTSCVTIAMP